MSIHPSSPPTIRPPQDPPRRLTRHGCNLLQNRMQCLGVSLALLFCFQPATFCWAQEDASGDSDAAGETESNELVDFQRDVFPIFQRKCLQCHGPEDAKNDFRVDDRDTLLSYVEPGDLESSSLWTDYLVTDDPDMRMPPPDADDAEPLTAAELALIHVWIEQGAQWPEDFEPGMPQDAAPTEVPGEVVPDEAPATKDPRSAPLALRIWKFSGLFHPAVVHFPIALLTVSALFVLLSFVNREAFEPVAYHCFWIGTLMAIAACATGWSYAIAEGYGSKISFDWENSAIDRHRWLGIAVAAVGVLTFPLARAVRRSGHAGARILWLVASLALAGGVATVGYQGGELVYGEDHYLQEYERLFGPLSVEEAASDDDVPAEPSPSTEAPEDEDRSENASAQPWPGGIPPRPTRPTLPGEEPSGGEDVTIDPESDSDGTAQGQEDLPEAVIDGGEEAPSGANSADGTNSEEPPAPQQGASSTEPSATIQ
ncbi:MAG: hypothetical protein D6753_11265 [Planctomycetota bacterium]|nr:MAG: hypothetical protein D6753_11265 [Planctomycetota bacterium]